MNKLLVIPDLHGRPFWKKTVEDNINKVDKIIFLGDYLDPYPWEGITRKDAIRNFDDVIAFKASNEDKVVLLLGNHDLQYVNKRKFYTRSRYDSSNSYHIEGMFRSHRSFFKIAHEEYVNGKMYLFSHSALIPQWYERHKELIGELNVENLNKLLDIPQGITALCEVSRYRGGYDKDGSIVWAHITEAENLKEKLNENIPWGYQIFGHSQQEKYPVIKKEFACLDCRQAFILDDEGKLIEIPN